MAGMAQQIPARQVLHHLPQIEHRDVIGDPLGQFQVVGDQQEWFFRVP
jgi:hypothetical protein